MLRWRRLLPFALPDKNELDHGDPDDDEDPGESVLMLQHLKPATEVRKILPKMLLKVSNSLGGTRDQQFMYRLIKLVVEILTHYLLPTPPNFWDLGFSKQHLHSAEGTYCSH